MCELYILQQRNTRKELPNEKKTTLLVSILLVTIQPTKWIYI